MLISNIDGSFLLMCNLLMDLIFVSGANFSILNKWSEDCFYYCSESNNLVVLFGTLKVRSFIVTKVSDCGLLIVVTSSTFLKRKDMLKEKSS